MFTNNKNIKYASNDDVCQLCLRKFYEKEKEKIGHRKNYFEIKKELTGKLVGQKVFYITVSGQHIYVCKNCLEKILKEMNYKYEKKEPMDIDIYLEKGDNTNEQ